MTNYVVFSGQTATFNDPPGVSDIEVDHGGEIIDSFFFGDTIDLYGLAVSSLLSNAAEIIHSGGMDSGSTVMGDVIVSSGGQTIDVRPDRPARVPRTMRTRSPGRRRGYSSGTTNPH